MCLNFVAFLLQSSTLDTIAATVAKDSAVQAAAVSLVKAASAASGAYWTSAPKVRPGVPSHSAALRTSIGINKNEVAHFRKCTERKLATQRCILNAAEEFAVAFAHRTQQQR